MKTILLIFLYILSFQISNAQWLSDVRLTNDPAFSYTSINNAWCIASSGSDVHVVWYDNRGGNEEIYYKRSTDGGASWGADIRLTNNSGSSGWPSISVSGQVVHVVWEDTRDGNYEIYYKRSIDAGIQWEADTRLTVNSAVSANASVSSSGSVVYVAWVDNRNGNNEVYGKSSTDAGVSWWADNRLTNNSAVSENSSVTVSGAVVHVVWDDNRDGNYEIYYKRSADGGINWGGDTRLTNNSSVSAIPSVSISSSDMHVVWTDNRDGNWEIYCKRSTDGGTSWGADTRLTNDPADSWYSSVSVSGSVVHVVWQDSRDGNEEIYYNRSSDGGVNWGSDTRLTNDSADSEFPSVAVSGTSVHVVWKDNRDGNWEIYYKHDPTGNPIGIVNINTEIPNQFSLSQNYPNPFNPSTKIQFALPKSSSATLVVYDALGRKLETLVNDQLSAGTYEADWNATNFANGVYYYKLTAGDYIETKKMVLVK